MSDTHCRMPKASGGKLSGSCIYFYFEHTESSHCLCFCDREGGPDIPGESTLRFHPGSGHSEDTAVISRLNLHHRVNSNASTYRE